MLGLNCGTRCRDPSDVNKITNKTSKEIIIIVTHDLFNNNYEQSCRQHKRHECVTLNINIKGKPGKVKQLKNVKNKGRERHLPDVCRHPRSGDSSEKKEREREKKRTLQPTLWLSSAIDVD